uniref:Uncharacterized protein n=1 Tax=Salmo trutta TaxID=8032 RepID=A0A674D247_SALTR
MPLIRFVTTFSGGIDCSACKSISAANINTAASFSIRNPKRQCLQGMPGEYVPQTGPMGMSMAPPSYNPTHQMTPHPSQLRHGHPLHPYLPGPHHPHHPAMLMHGGPPSHPGITMSAERQDLDIHAQ